MWVADKKLYKQAILGVFISRKEAKHFWKCLHLTDYLNKENKDYKSWKS